MPIYVRKILIDIPILKKHQIQFICLILIIKITMQCHLCAEKESSSLARCCIKKCNKSYCLSCIRKQFNSDFLMEMYKRQTWICYGCQSLCNCKKCAKGESNDKKSKKKPKLKSISDDTNDYNPSSTSQTNKKTQRVGQLAPQSPIIHEGMIEQQSQSPQFRLYSQQDLSTFPPFYRKIIERRQQFYNCSIREGKHFLKKLNPTEEEQQKNN